jgi:hypothetical protein
MFEQLASDRADPLDAHEHDLRAGRAASCAKSSELSVFAGSSWPVKMVSCALCSRCVTGTPA